MKKYAAMTTHFEADPKTKSIENAVANYGAETAVRIVLVDTIEEAREVLKDFRPSTREHKWNAQHCYVIDAAYIEEGEWEYDEDYEQWEFLTGGDIWDVYCEELPSEEEDEE